MSRRCCCGAKMQASCSADMNLAGFRSLRSRLALSQGGGGMLLAAGVRSVQQACGGRGTLATCVAARGSAPGIRIVGRTQEGIVAVALEDARETQPLLVADGDDRQLVRASTRSNPGTVVFGPALGPSHADRRLPRCALPRPRGSSSTKSRPSTGRRDVRWCLIHKCPSCRTCWGSPFATCSR